MSCNINYFYNLPYYNRKLDTNADHGILHYATTGLYAAIHMTPFIDLFFDILHNLIAILHHIFTKFHRITEYY